jgi:hypothetical protein
LDVGAQVIASVLDEPKTLKKLIEARFDLGWMSAKDDLSRAAIFDEEHASAYKLILRHWDAHREVPSRAFFEQSFPPESLRLPRVSLSSAELLTLARQTRKRVQLDVAGSEFVDLFDAGEYDAVENLLETTVRRLQSERSQAGVVVAWDSADYDLESRLTRVETPGIRSGIAEWDAVFPGWQPGQLVTLLGRAKAAKTSHLLKSALAAHDDGWNTLVTSVEIGADDIAERFDSFAAGVSYESYIRGRLTDREKVKIRAARSQRGDGEMMMIVQPLSVFTVTDLEAEIDRYNPQVVYVDGFYFMIDRTTGKPGGNWEGHDNLARELKELAMRRDLTIVVTTQIREKQAGQKKGGGFDDNTMMGGTGLIMASDMVITLDMDENQTNTLTCSRTRTIWLPKLRGQWKWKHCQFETIPDDYEDFDEDNQGDDDD